MQYNPYFFPKAIICSKNLFDLVDITVFLWYEMLIYLWNYKSVLQIILITLLVKPKLVVLKIQRALNAWTNITFLI